MHCCVIHCAPCSAPQFRYMLLCLAATEAPLLLPIGERGLYGQECVFMANDWHAALVPVYLAAKYRPHGVYTKARSILAIHNLRHQVSVLEPCRSGSTAANRGSHVCAPSRQSVALLFMAQGWLVAKAVRDAQPM